MGRWRTEMGKQVGGREYEWGGGRPHTQGEGASEGGTCHVRGTHGRLRSGVRATSMGLHMERVSKVCAASGQREISQRECRHRQDMQKEDIHTRESHPTLYPGDMVGENEASMDPVRQRRNTIELTGRAKANQQRQERKEEIYKNRRLRLAEGENGTRRVSERPEPGIGGGEWELPPHTEDIMARRFMGGQDGRGKLRVLKDETMNLVHEEKYAGHPILILFTRPEKMENGTYMRMSKEYITHLKAPS
eukprot:6199508-Pleurochrysis_carterae.AAC.1